MPRPHLHITTSPAETKKIGRAWGKKIKNGAIIALTGTLGSGKTTFVQGLALGLGLRRKISSPTFITMAAYPIPGTLQTFYHLDLYRIHGGDDTRELGLTEIIKRQRDVIAIEWPEKIKAILPKRTKWIHFSHAYRNPKLRVIKSS